MTPATTAAPPTRALAPTATRPKRPRTRALALSGALAVLGLIAAACGEDGSSREAVQADTAGSEAATAEPTPSSDFMATRPGAGIAAAGGNPSAIQGDNPCNQPGGSSDPVTIAYVGSNLAELEAIGLEAIVAEEPGRIISAYVNEVNFNGGINGRCVEFVNHLWSLADPASSFTQICNDLPPQQPMLILTLGVWPATLECATLAAQIPTIGLYASIPAATFDQTGDRLYVDDGSVEHILSASLSMALSSAVIGPDDRIGLLHGSGASAGMGISESRAIIDGLGLETVATANVPAEYADLQLLLEEKTIGLLEGPLEEGHAHEDLDHLPPELAELFEEMEHFYLDAAARFKDTGVTAVAATAGWADMRRLMRAAELTDWTPQWIANDIQPATIVLADSPKRQVENLVLVSSRRAAGDEVPDLDQGCVTLRNTASEAPPFAHRLHTDAYTLLTAICDYLDVAFSAMTRVRGRITADTFVEALNDTEYNAPYGGRITFAADDYGGAERFRVLQADPDCVLNFWGCMRSITDWSVPAHTVGSTA